MYKFIFLLTCSISLAACLGIGGGGNGNGSPPVTPSATFAPDTIHASDILLQIPGQGRSRIFSSCGPTACTFNYQGDSFRIPISDFLEPPETTSNINITNTTNKGGIDISGYNSLIGSEVGNISTIGYGAWLDYNAFISADAEVTSGDLRGVNLQFSISGGEATGKNPTAIGGGEWLGGMVGIDYGSANQQVIGDASITIENFENPELDVAFTELSEGRADMNWDSITVSSGRFDGGSIEGSFYGPNAEEVGGVFDRDGIIGAFGAKR